MEKESISIHYAKFFEKFKEIKDLPIEKWSKTHLLAYFCELYKNHYNLDFTFSFKGSPSKCREMFEISKLTQQISSNPIILKQYIDWIFKEKIIEKKKRVTSLGFLTHPEIVNEFKFKFLFSNKIERTTQLPEKYIAICRDYKYHLSTYGDLAFIYKSNPEMSDKLEQEGFKINILETLK